MDIGSAKPVLTGVTSPAPKAPTEQNLATKTDLRADKAVGVTEKTEGNDVDTATDKQRPAQAPSNALNANNTVKAKARDQVVGFDLQAESDPSSSAAATTSIDVPEATSANKGNQGTQESAMRMQAMIDAWQGTGGTSRSSVYDGMM